MNAKRKQLVNKYVAMLKEKQPAFDITAMRIVWWNPLSWFFRRFRKAVLQHVSDKQYRKAVKAALQKFNYVEVME